MFSGALVDTRSASQRARDRERERPQQTEMFSQRDLAQFGVRAHPQMFLSAETKLVLISEDPRTDEERECDSLLAAQKQTYPLFAEPAVLLPEHLTEAANLSVPLSSVGMIENTEETPTPPQPASSPYASGVLWSAKDWLQRSFPDVPSTLRIDLKQFVSPALSLA